MSINYVRDILRISLSQICHLVGFDSISESCLDILIDVCEKQFQFVFKQISNEIQLIDQENQLEFSQLVFFLFEKSFEDFHIFQQFLQQFQSTQFNQQIVRFPFKKKNQIFLRIPSQQSNEFIQRQNHENTCHIYDWLPLFPHQETSEDISQIDSQHLFDENHLVDQEKNLSKDPSNHHPLTLSSFINENNEETNPIPIGIKPKRSLPKIVYRPRRLIEIDAATAAEKAKKNLLEKENIEKEQATIQPPLRLTIAKPPPTDKSISPIKKTITNQDKKPSQISLNNSINPKIIHNSNSNPNIETNLTDTSTNNHDKNQPQQQQTPLDLTKPSTTNTIVSTKVPTFKLSLKTVNPTPTNINPDNPPTATKKSAKSSTPTTNPEKVNLKIRTSSLPLFGTNSSTTNSDFNSISPIINLPQENNNIQLPIANLSQNDLLTEDEKKKKKKKKSETDNPEKRIKTESIDFNLPNEQPQPQPMDIDLNTSSNHNSSLTTPPIGGAIKVKIKLGKPSTNIPTTEEQQQAPSSSTPIQQDNQIIKNPLKLKLSVNPNSSSKNVNVNKKRSIKIKDIPEKIDVNPLTNEDNTNSIDDLPLGARTSPSKMMFNQIQTDPSQDVLFTPIKNKPKTSSTKKKSITKKQNDIGVAVIEERRIDHDSQEKIWICPSCNRPDNGQEAMIACDLCDDWYHWECVGIVEEPPESIPWFCPKCHRSNSSTTSAQSIKPSASSKAKRQRASILYQQKQQQHSNN